MAWQAIDEIPKRASAGTLASFGGMIGALDGSSEAVDVSTSKMARLDLRGAFNIPEPLYRKFHSVASSRGEEP